MTPLEALPILAATAVAYLAGHARGYWLALAERYRRRSREWGAGSGARTLTDLERRELLSTVILCDIDTGADPLSEWDGEPLSSYLVPGINFSNPGAPATDQLGFGGHGSIMAGQYASALARAGLPATVMPLVVADTEGSINPAAVAAALEWVAAAQTAHPEFQFIVSVPIAGFLPWPSEQAGLAALDRAGVPVAIAAGNSADDLDAAPVYPASSAAGLGNVIVATALDPAGDLASYADWGPRSVQVALSSQATDGYGHTYDLASSGASATAAAWLAEIVAANPRPATEPGPNYAAQVVQAVESLTAPTPATQGLIANGVLGSTPVPVSLPPLLPGSAVIHPAHHRLRHHR